MIRASDHGQQETVLFLSMDTRLNRYRLDMVRDTCFAFALRGESSMLFGKTLKLLETAKKHIEHVMPIAAQHTSQGH
jgi:hypothetical protein